MDKIVEIGVQIEYLIAKMEELDVELEMVRGISNNLSNASYGDRSDRRYLIEKEMEIDDEYRAIYGASLALRKLKEDLERNG